MKRLSYWFLGDLVLQKYFDEWR